MRVSEEKLMPSLLRRGLAVVVNPPSYHGMQFADMSDEFLLQSFDELCEKTAGFRPNPDDWMEEHTAAKGEILKRMKKEEL